MRLLLTLSFATASLFLGGCGSLHLHDQAAEDSAAAAKADLDASKLGDWVKGQRATLAALEQREVTAFHKLTLASRDQVLLALSASSELSSPKQAPDTRDGFAYRFLERVDRRLIELDGDPDVRATTRRTAFAADARLTQFTQSQQQTRKSLAFIDPGFATIPDCNAAVAALAQASDGAALAALVDPAHAATAQSLWPAVRPHVNSLGQACVGQLKAEKDYDDSHAAPGFLLASAIAEHNAQAKASAAAASAAKEAKAQLTQGARELAAATTLQASRQAIPDLTCPASDEAGAGAGAGAAAGAEARTTPAPAPTAKLCDALAKLDKLGSLGEKILAEEKIARIGQVLQALSGITPEGGAGEVDDALALLAATTRLQHALVQYRVAGKWPPLESLIIEKQLAEARLASANARVALDKARLADHAEMVAALRLEITLLEQARYNLLGGFGGRDLIRQRQPCTKDTAKRCASFEALLRSTEHENGVPAERQAYRAMAALAESYSVARDRQAAAAVRLANSGYRESLVRSEEALASWQAVLATPVDLLRRYHAGGIKPEHVAPLLQALGIFTIAARVD